jgi:small redox-active disulfide protein 2
MQLLVLGTGCAKCGKLHEVTEQAAKELGLPYELHKVTDLRRIMALGVMVTPALAVNGTIKVTGKVPSVAELKGILSQTAATEKS